MTIQTVWQTSDPIISIPVITYIPAINNFSIPAFWNTNRLNKAELASVVAIIERTYGKTASGTTLSVIISIVTNFVSVPHAVSAINFANKP